MSRRQIRGSRPRGSGRRPSKAPPPSGFVGFVKDLGVSVLVVVIVMIVLFGYTGVWPPVVVVESGSMRHADDSAVGIIDTGDLTLVKSIDDRRDVVTWLEGNPRVNFTASNASDTISETRVGRAAGHATYGEWGDVIVYRKNGAPSTPVIHRAMVWIEPVAGCAGARVPDLGLPCVNELRLHRVGFRQVELRINLVAIVGHMGGAPHPGFLTKGDHNNGSPTSAFVQVDQESLRVGGAPPGTSVPVQPAAVGWVVGQAQGELPWFGLIKLLGGGQVIADCTDIDQKDRCAPPTSVRSLIASLILIIVVPLIIDILSARWRRQKAEAAAAGKLSKQRGRAGRGEGGLTVDDGETEDEEPREEHDHEEEDEEEEKEEDATVDEETAGDADREAGDDVEETGAAEADEEPDGAADEDRVVFEDTEPAPEPGARAARGGRRSR